MKLITLTLVLLGTAFSAQAGDITLRFDPVSGATGYRIQMNSTMDCVGGAWTEARDTEGLTDFIWEGAPEGNILLFRAVAYDDTRSEPVESVRKYSGAWYDWRLYPLDSPAGAGIE